MNLITFCLKNVGVLKKFREPAKIRFCRAYSEEKLMFSAFFNFCRSNFLFGNVDFNS